MAQPASPITAFDPINPVDQPLLAAPADPLGKIIFWRYFPYDQTRVNWERAKEQAAANPYAVQLELLRQEVSARRASLDTYLKAIQAEQTPLERKLAEAEAAKSKRGGGRGGGGGGLSEKDKLEGWDKVSRGEETQTKATQELRAAERQKALKIGRPDPAVLAPNTQMAQVVKQGKATGLTEEQIQQQLNAFQADPTGAVAKAAQSDDPLVRASNAVNLEQQLTSVGIAPAEAKTRAAAVYNVPSDLVDAKGLELARGQMLAGAEGITVEPSTGRAEMRAILQKPSGRGGARALTPQEEADLRAKSLDPMEQLAVQRYIEALGDDYQATAADIGAGKPFKDQAEMDAGRAAYEKAANLGAYTRAQAPYFSPEFLKQGRELMALEKAKSTIGEAYGQRAGRSPLEVQQEQARLFLEQQRILRGEPAPIPRPSDEVGGKWWDETKAKRPWLLDSMARANQILREEGDGVLEGGMSEARRRRLTGEAKAQRQLDRAQRLTEQSVRLEAKYGPAKTDEVQDQKGPYVRYRSGRIIKKQYGEEIPVTDPKDIANYEAAMGPAKPIRESYFRQPDVEAKDKKAIELRAKGQAGMAAATGEAGTRRAQAKVSGRLASFADPWEFAKDLYDINPDEAMDVVRVNVQKRFEDPEKAQHALDYYVARKLAMEHKAKTNQPIEPQPALNEVPASTVVKPVPPISPFDRVFNRIPGSRNTSSSYTE